MTRADDHTEDSNNENFEEMLEQSMNRRDDFEIGTKVEGKVVYTSDEFVFVDISGKSEAVIGADEFRNDDGTLSVKAGDPITAYVVSRTGGEIHLTTSIGRGSMNPGLMQMAYHESIPVYGTVIDTVKGGYSISVGGMKCFCPVSQIDMRAPSDPKSMLNRSFLFKIIEFKERGKNIIVSRSALLEEQRKQTEDSLKADPQTGRPPHRHRVRHPRFRRIRGHRRHGSAGPEIRAFPEQEHGHRRLQDRGQRSMPPLNPSTGTAGG